jgi:hypothetical protein
MWLPSIKHGKRANAFIRLRGAQRVETGRSSPSFVHLSDGSTKISLTNQNRVNDASRRRVNVAQGNHPSHVDIVSIHAYVARE